MSDESIKTCFYVLKTNQIEVSLGLKFDDGDDDFEDVTFLVMNCSDPLKALGRVVGFVKVLAEEFQPVIDHEILIEPDPQKVKMRVLS